MPIQTNYIDELVHTINFEINDAAPVLAQYHLSPYDIVNLCGGIPAPYITSIRVIMHATYNSALSVQISSDQYEVVRNIDFQIGRIDNNHMVVVHPGEGLGTNLFLTQVKTARRFRFKKLHMTALIPDGERNWTGYYFWAELGYENTDIEEFHAWAAEMGREELTLSELVQSESGRRLWRQSGFIWIGNFYLNDDHACTGYLRQHLKRKGIDFDI
ncbi:MAG: hypothetical protein JST68_31040 [Bacteroidetes bacterium]|nr:hypothetical protein [Bacteroidota bacterium]